MNDLIFMYVKTSGEPVSRLHKNADWQLGLFHTAFRPVQSHALGFLDLNDARIMHDDFHHAVAE
jgi:hypothetical protein